MKKSIDELLEKPYWVIDILPKQVPENSPGQYFAVERYFLQGKAHEALRERHISLILKLNCYRDLNFVCDDNFYLNPPPDQIGEMIRQEHTLILVDEALIMCEPDDTNLTLFNPDEELLELVKLIAAGEGLYVWKP